MVPGTTSVERVSTPVVADGERPGSVVGGRKNIGWRRFWYRFSVLKRAGDDGRGLEGWAASPAKRALIPRNEN